MADLPSPKPESYASICDELGGVVPGAEAELHALLAWQDGGERGRAAPAASASAAASPRAPDASSQGTDAFASSAHDDAGVSALPVEASPPASTRVAGEAPRRAPASDPHSAASDDCTCS